MKTIKVWMCSFHYFVHIQTLNFWRSPRNAMDMPFWTQDVLILCGEKWMENFIERLSDEERERMKIEPSEQSFTFGDGVSVPSLRRVTMPCWMGGIPGEISTDVIDRDIPLLLSKKSMKRNKMKIDLETDEVIVNKRSIKLKVTKTYHYALPIRL